MDVICCGEACSLVRRIIKNGSENEIEKEAVEKQIEVEEEIQTIEQIESAKLEEKISIPQPSDEIEWIVYGASWCPFCTRAKDHLEKSVGGDKFIYVDIETYMSPHEFKKLMVKETNNYETIPMIFNKTKFIGGYSDLRKLQ